MLVAKTGTRTRNVKDYELQLQFKATERFVHVLK